MSLTDAGDIDITDNFDEPLNTDALTWIGNKPFRSAVVSLSGGMDSAVALALAIASFGEDKVHAVSYNYGQRHRTELLAAAKLAKRYKVEHSVIDLPRSVFMGFGSPLVESNVEVENQTYQEMIAAQGMAQTVVPNRNMVLLSIATAYAMSHKLDSVWIGAHAEDARNFAYSDCTPEFNLTMAVAIKVATYERVHLFVPFQDSMKGDIVKLGLQLNVPFELTMSCYRGLSPACGKCPTCSERKAAFEAAGMKDPIPYEV